MSLTRAASADLFQPIVPPRAVQVMVHRGVTASAPENTIPAFQAAIDAGFEWIEVDVRLTRDGHHVLLHDSTLDRTTDGSGPVANLDLAALKRLDAGSWFAPRYAQTRIPTLSEALAFCKGKVNLYLDCKAIDAARLVKDIQEQAMQPQVAVFDDPQVLETVRTLSNGTVPIMPSINARLEVDYWVERLQPIAVEVHAERLTPQLVKDFHRANVIVQAQTLGERDRPEVWRACFEMGVDWIQTDYGENVLAEFLRYTSGGQRSVKVAAHRGAKQFAPENTLAAYRKALELGVDYIEIDVRTTRDGRLVSIHDGELDRTTNGSGPVEKIAFDDLRALSAGAWFGVAYKDEKVPTLAEICELLNAYHAHHQDRPGYRETNLYVDCKDVDPQKLAGILRAHGKLDDAVFYGSPDELLAIRRAASKAKLMPPLGDPADLRPRATSIEPYAFDTRWSILSEALISEAHGIHIEIFSDAMGTPETVNSYRQAMQWGIDTIQTDFIPRVYRAIELEALR